MFLTREEVLEIGFYYVGKDVRISDKAVFYNPANIEIGDHSRIDDFAILSAGVNGIYIGRYVHVGCHATLIGAGSIILQDFSCISGRVSIYSSSDDYSGKTMANACVPDEFKDVTHAPVILRKGVLVGANTVILPGVVIGTGSAIGACSLVTQSVPDFEICAGVPVKFIRKRNKNCVNWIEKIDY